MPEKGSPPYICSIVLNASLQRKKGMQLNSHGIEEFFIINAGKLYDKSSLVMNNVGFETIFLGSERQVIN